MKRVLAGVAVVFMVACDGRPSGSVDEEAWVREQRRRYELQTDRADALQERSDLQAKRMDALLDRWETQADRYDAILEHWERQQKAEGRK